MGVTTVKLLHEVDRTTSCATVEIEGTCTIGSHRAIPRGKSEALYPHERSMWITVLVRFTALAPTVYPVVGLYRMDKHRVDYII